MDRLELSLLGPPRVSIEGRESTFRTRKALALLAFLAAEGDMHRREKLAELLWPRSTNGRARTTLRSTLARIRHELREVAPACGGELLRVEGDLLGVDARPDLRVDLDVLRDASAAARASRRDGGKDENLIATLREADAAYRGEFLEGFRIEDAPEFDFWLEAQRSLWRGRIGEVLERLAEMETERGKLAAAAETAGRRVERDPSEEAARVGLMRARSAAGDPGGALDAYEEYRSELQGIGMDPGPGAQTLNASMREEAARTGEVRPAPGSLRMPFVGRGAAFGALIEEYRAARSGTVRSAVVVGEAGIGKTRLAEEFLGWAASEGADVLRARASEAAGHQPYETLVDALRPRLERERAPDDLLEDRWLAELSRIMPELGDRYPDLPQPTSDEASSQALLFEAVARLGAALAGGSSDRGGAGGSGEPLVVFMDDLQWADGATLDALSYACRSWARDGVPLLLLLTVREEGLRKNGLGRWLSSLERELAVRRLALSPMDEGDVHSLLRLIAGTTGPDESGTRREDLEHVGRWLLKESEGHPLFLAQILGILVERGVLVEHVGSDGRTEVALSEGRFDEDALRGLVPAGLRELILDKLRPLAADASDILAAGAVLGRGFGFDELLRVAGVGETEGIAALDGLVSARLLEEGGTPSVGFPSGAYSYTHDKIREVVYTEAGEARRGVFHRRALEYLEDRGASASELAQHALAARLGERAFGYLLAAAEGAMAVFAAGDAIGHYERARDLLADRPRGVAAAGGEGVPGRLRLYGGLARARALVHDLARAREAYEGMLAVAEEAGDREAEWEALHGLGVLAIGLTHGPEDEELLRGVRGREGLGEHAGSADGAEEGPEHARSWAAHSIGYARRCAQRALRLAHELGREDLVLRSEFGLGFTLGWSGQWEEAVAHLEVALSLHAALGDETPDASTLVNLSWANGMVAWGRGMISGPAGAFGPTGVLQKLWRPTTGLSGALDTDFARAQLGAAASGLAMAGEYEEAIGKATRGVEAARVLGHPLWEFLSLSGLGDAHQETFGLAAARSTYLEMFDCASFSTHEKDAHTRLCAVAALSGEWDLAYEHALKSSGLEKELYLPVTYLHRHHDIEALLRGGDVDPARENLRLFDRRTGGQKGYFRLAYLRSEAVLARWDGDPDRTLSLLQEALGLAERLGLPGEAWQVGAALGEAHEDRGETGLSERAFGRASVVIHGLDANMNDEDLRKRYLAAPQVRRVLEKARAQGVHPGSPVL